MVKITKYRHQCGGHEQYDGEQQALYGRVYRRFRRCFHRVQFRFVTCSRW